MWRSTLWVWQGNSGILNSENALNRLFLLFRLRHKISKRWLWISCISLVNEINVTIRIILSLGTHSCLIRPLETLCSLLRSILLHASSLRFKLVLDTIAANIDSWWAPNALRCITGISIFLTCDGNFWPFERVSKTCSSAWEIVWLRLIWNHIGVYTIMTYCTTCLKLLVGSWVETYTLNALEAVVYQREYAISPGFRDANVGS